MKTNNLKSHVPLSIISAIPTIKDLNSDLRLCHFLSQCSHESGRFQVTQENLYYSVDGLLRIFPKYFTSAIAPRYAKQPEKIANRIYAGRNGNGDEPSGDGWKYRGRGYIQLTGRANYLKFSKFINDDCVKNPDLISKKYPLSSAGFFFTFNNIWRVCDLGSSNIIITKVTKIINGGRNGLIDRIHQFERFANILGISKDS